MNKRTYRELSASKSGNLMQSQMSTYSRLFWSQECRQRVLPITEFEHGFNVIACMCVGVSRRKPDIQHGEFVALQSWLWLVGTVNPVIVALCGLIYPSLKVDKRIGLSGQLFY